MRSCKYLISLRTFCTFGALRTLCTFGALRTFGCDCVDALPAPVLVLVLVAVALAAAVAIALAAATAVEVLRCRVLLRPIGRPLVAVATVCPVVAAVAAAVAGAVAGGTTNPRYSFRSFAVCVSGARLPCLLLPQIRNIRFLVYTPKSTKKVCFPSSLRIHSISYPGLGLR